MICILFCRRIHSVEKSCLWLSALTLGHSGRAYGGRGPLWMPDLGLAPIISVLVGARQHHHASSCLTDAWKWPLGSPPLPLWDKGSDSANIGQHDFSSCVTLNHYKEYTQASCVPNHAPRDLPPILAMYSSHSASVKDHISPCLYVSDLIYVQRFRSGLL